MRLHDLDRRCRDRAGVGEIVEGGLRADRVRDLLVDHGGVFRPHLIHQPVVTGRLRRRIDAQKTIHARRPGDFAIGDAKTANSRRAPRLRPTRAAHVRCFSSASSAATRAVSALFRFPPSVFSLTTTRKGFVDPRMIELPPLKQRLRKSYTQRRFYAIPVNRGFTAISQATAPARSAKYHARCASGRTASAFDAAFALAAVPSRTRPTMPWRMPAMRKKLYDV